MTVWEAQYFDILGCKNQRWPLEHLLILIQKTIMSLFYTIIVTDQRMTEANRFCKTQANTSLSCTCPEIRF